VSARCNRLVRGRLGRVGAVLAAGALSAGAAVALRPASAESPWAEARPAGEGARRSAEAAPPAPAPWPEPVADDSRGGWDVFTPPALRWDPVRGEWTDEPAEVEVAGGADEDGGGAKPAEPRVEVIAAGGRFRPVQLAGYVRGAAGLAGLFEMGARRELAVGVAGTTWPALGLRVEAIGLKTPTDEGEGAGRARAVVRDLATGEAVELVEGVPALRGEARAWLRLEGAEQEHALEVGGRLRAGERSARVERVDLATRRVHLVMEDDAGGQERRVERVSLRREEDGP
jgi:hypothetical protein